jgi:hypothetical protein
MRRRNEHTLLLSWLSVQMSVQLEDHEHEAFWEYIMQPHSHCLRGHVSSRNETSISTSFNQHLHGNYKWLFYSQVNFEKVHNK